jgi:hypothetical protein
MIQFIDNHSCHHLLGIPKNTEGKKSISLTASKQILDQGWAILIRLQIPAGKALHLEQSLMLHIKNLRNTPNLIVPSSIGAQEESTELERSLRSGLSTGRG